MSNPINNFSLDATQVYDRLKQLAVDTQHDVSASYRVLRPLLEHCCRQLTPNSTLQITDLSARIRYVASLLKLSPAQENALHTCRLTANDALHHRRSPERSELLRDLRTVALFVARLTSVEPPADLLELLPHAQPPKPHAQPAVGHRRRMRVSYVNQDADYLYVMPTDELADVPLRVHHGVESINQEFEPTCQVLWPHAQLNLLGVSIDREGILTPYFIVLEPDYLIDVSALAECVKDYGQHPANYMLSRLMPSVNARPLLLGNIANLFLDEWIHAGGESPDYTTCMKKAFHMAALPLAACRELADPDASQAFNEDCKRHFSNIGEVVTRHFTDSANRLDPTDAVIEPSFICEPLGLQGRLDYLQRDLSAFIEMKSGRAEEYAMRPSIVPKENNRGQMALYLAMLEHCLQRDHHDVRPYLLYTRYPLLYNSIGDWARVRRLIDLRNRIVAREYQVQLHNDPAYTATLLADINPDTLNEKKLNGKFWQLYLAPPISQLRQSIQSLSPIERAYFLRLYTFITKELYTKKSGDQDHDGPPTGPASAWLASADEKTEAGEMLTDLRIMANQAADADNPLIVFGIERMEQGEQAVRRATPNFRQGDAVVIYQHNRADDTVCNHQVFKGSIEELTPQQVSVRLRSAQQNAGVLPTESRYAIEHDSPDSPFNAMFAGLAHFVNANQERRDLLLGQRQPRASEDESEWDRGDDLQRVVHKALSAQDYFLLVGPPGTGKTSMALRGMVEEMLKRGQQLLLMSYTNRAVDEVCKMLERINPTPAYIRLGSPLSCDPAFHHRLADQVLADLPTREAVRRRIEACPIVVGTTTTLALRTDIFLLKTFDVALIDEATQILEPQLLGLLCQRNPGGDNAIGKFILIGDHKQLPAVVCQTSAQSAVDDPLLNAIGLTNLNESLFQRLLRGLGRATPEGHLWESPFCDMLRRQGRMHPALAAFPSRAFYGNRLMAVGLEHQLEDLPPASSNDALERLLSRRLAFIPTQAQTDGPHKANAEEAQVAADLASAIYRRLAPQGLFTPEHTIGIITPYRLQVATIRDALARTGIPDLMRITTDTVERYQGSERDVIIYSFCVNRPMQLRYLSTPVVQEGALVDRKLNVALTRARKQIFLIGDPKLLYLNEIYKELIAACR